MFHQFDTRCKLLVSVLVILWIFGSALPAFAKEVSGAIWTTTSSGTIVNENVGYNTKDEVYLNGGPKKGIDHLSNGRYYIKVTEPSGKVLGSSVNSQNPNLTKYINITNGNFPGLIQLSRFVYTASSNFINLGYDDTANKGGEYKVWVSLEDPNFSPPNTKTDNFKIRVVEGDHNPPPPPGDDHNPPPPPGDDHNPPPPPGDDNNPPPPPGDDNNPPPPPGDDNNPPPPPGDNNGGVTPPASENVTPLVVRITPDRVPAGDPTITVQAPEDVQSVYAFLPEGRRLDLKYDQGKKLWKTSFLVPFGTPDGPYTVKIFINRQNRTLQYNYTIIIDNGIPLIILNQLSNDQKSISLRVTVLFPATSLTAELDGQIVALVKDARLDVWSGKVNIPFNMVTGTYQIILRAKDDFGHISIIKCPIDINNKSLESAKTVSVTNDFEEPVVKVQPNESEKRNTHNSLAFGSGSIALSFLGLVLARKRYKL